MARNTGVPIDELCERFSLEELNQMLVLGMLEHTEKSKEDVRFEALCSIIFELGKALKAFKGKMKGFNWEQEQEASPERNLQMIRAMTRLFGGKMTDSEGNVTDYGRNNLNTKSSHKPQASGEGPRRRVKLRGSNGKGTE